MPQSEQGSIPLFIVHPLTASLEQTLPYLFLNETRFSVKVIEFNPGLLSMASYVRPCVCIFSVVDEASRKRLRQMLEDQVAKRLGKGQSRTDQALRVVVISEEKQGVTLDSWHDFGAHEVIIAPILSRPLVHKLERHYQKALKALEEEKKTTPPVAKPQSKPVATENKVKQPQFVVHGVALGPNTFLFPPEERDKGDLRVVMEPPSQVLVSVALSAETLGEGQWVESSPGVWDFVISRMPDIEIRYRFFGQQPRFDASNQTWVFQGEAPKLFAANERVKSEPIDSPANLVFLTTKNDGVIFFKSKAADSNTKVMYFSKEQWEKSPLKVFEKEPAKPAWGRGGNERPEKEFKGERHEYEKEDFGTRTTLQKALESDQADKAWAEEIERAQAKKTKTAPVADSGDASQTESEKRTEKRMEKRADDVDADEVDEETQAEIDRAFFKALADATKGAKK